MAYGSTWAGEGGYIPPLANPQQPTQYPPPYNSRNPLPPYMQQPGGNVYTGRVDPRSGAFTPQGGAFGEAGTASPWSGPGRSNTIYGGFSGQPITGAQQIAEGNRLGYQNQFLGAALRGLGGYNQPFAQPSFNIPPPVNYPQTSANVPNIDAATGAAFGLAKAQAGQMGASALRGLQQQLADRSLLGSGEEAQGLVNILSASTQPLAEENVAELQQRIGLAQHAQDLAEKQGEAQFGGNIAQRGQTIGAGEQQAQLGLEAQQLRQQQQDRYLNFALQGLRGAGLFY